MGRPLSPRIKPRKSSQLPPKEVGAGVLMGRTSAAYTMVSPCGSWQSVMDAGTKKHGKNHLLSIFELEALREAFRLSVRENDVAEADWARHAELFVERMRQQGSRLTRA
jgi:hypothetical protein